MRRIIKNKKHSKNFKRQANKTKHLNNMRPQRGGVRL